MTKIRAQQSSNRRPGTSFLLPMHVQYLVGLCCLKANPDAVEVVLGNMVHDDAEARKRDVDVTVTVAESRTVVRAFEAYEVKDEGRPLDVATVEQLCLKLLDMGAVTHRAIVSVSGYTAGARRKAAYHGVDLFDLREWIDEQDRDRFPDFKFGFTGRRILCWREANYRLIAPNGPRDFTGDIRSAFYRHDGSLHDVFRTPSRFEDEILLRSTEILFGTKLKIEESFPDPLTVGWVGSPWPDSFTLDLKSDDVYIKFEELLIQVESVQIEGNLQWRIDQDRLARYLLQNDATGELFASALIILGQRDRQLFAVVSSPGSNQSHVQIVNLDEKHLKAIRELQLHAPP